MTDKWKDFVATLAPKEPSPTGERERNFIEEVTKYQKEVREWFNMCCGTSSEPLTVSVTAEFRDGPYTALMLNSGGGYSLGTTSLFELLHIIDMDLWRPMNRDPGDLESNLKVRKKVLDAYTSAEDTRYFQ